VVSESKAHAACCELNLMQAEDSKTAYLAALPGLTAVAAVLRIPLIMMDSGIQQSSPIPEVTPTITFTRLLQAIPTRAPQVRIRQTDTALLLYSSGTTGTSKGVIISHKNAIAAFRLTHGIPLNDDLQRTYIVTIPMFHLYGKWLCPF
jgi:acyl-CoA synthetase (AMP-forming)/AMP-acid ligase II